VSSSEFRTKSLVQTELWDELLYNNKCMYVHSFANLHGKGLKLQPQAAPARRNLAVSRDGPFLSLSALELLPLFTTLTTLAFEQRIVSRFSLLDCHCRYSSLRCTLCWSFSILYPCLDTSSSLLAPAYNASQRGAEAVCLQD
jgi:hypothetical protein